MAESFYNNGTDVIVICASAFAFIVMLARIIYKSKCKTISCCWNCINIDGFYCSNTNYITRRGYC